MTRILIRGNKESFQLTKKVDLVELSLEGDFNYGSKSKINFRFDGQNLSFENRDRLFQFSEEIKGESLDKLILNFNEFGFDQIFVTSLISKKSTESGLLKSLFLIYNWVDIQLGNPIDLNLGDKLFNEFVLDYYGQLGSQKDIYFIDEKYTKSEKGVCYSPFFGPPVLLS